MSRDLTSSMQTALQGTTLKPCIFCSIEFVSETLYLSSLNYDLDWDGHTWIGDGTFLGWSAVQESEENKATGVSIKLSAIDPAIVALVLGSTAHEKECNLYLGLFDASDDLIDDPYLLYNGKFDFATIEEDDQQSIVALQFENDQIQQKKIVEFRYTLFSQQAIFPDDTGFRYAPAAADFSGFWGKAARVQYIRKRKTVKK